MNKLMKDKQSPMNTSDEEDPMISPDVQEEDHEAHH